MQVALLRIALVVVCLGILVSLGWSVIQFFQKYSDMRPVGAIAVFCFVAFVLTIFWIALRYRLRRCLQVGNDPIRLAVRTGLLRIECATCWRATVRTWSSEEIKWVYVSAAPWISLFQRLYVIRIVPRRWRQSVTTIRFVWGNADGAHSLAAIIKQHLKGADKVDAKTHPH
jgi:hypothetical protein